MSSLSVIIPAWSATPELAEMTLQLCQQVRPMCDEIVVSEDGPYVKEIADAVDIYLAHPRLGHGTNLNLGFRVSTGEYVAMLDSDIVIDQGTLRKMCIPGKIVCPVHALQDKMQGWFVVAPRWVIAECPPYDRTDFYAEGLDFWAAELKELVKDRLVSTEEVTYFHGGVRGVHGGARSYSEFLRRVGRPGGTGESTKRRLDEDIAWQRARGKEDAVRFSAAQMPREIDHQRHLQRLDEDSQYRRVWLYTL